MKKKIAVVTGSRNWPTGTDIAWDLRRFAPDEIVHGNCPRGADYFAKTIAMQLGAKETAFDADWKQYGRQAGLIRNQKMIDYVTDKSSDSYVVVFAYRLNDSKGTTDCIKRAKQSKLNVVVKDMVGSVESP